MANNTLLSLYGSEFDPAKAILRTTLPEKLFNVTQTTLLQSAVARNEVAPTDSLQVVEIAGRVYSFRTRELLEFDVAQGDNGTHSWIVTFCPICNAGASFSALVEGRTLHFAAGGIYNAMALLRDIETGSYWDHIFGICLHGELRGRQLTRLAYPRHLRAAEAITVHPNAEFASARLTAEETAESIEDDKWRTAEKPEWSARLSGTLVQEDNRLPRFDMGLGIWTERTARYYPILTLNAADNAIVDTLDGRRLLIYVDAASSLPDAFYTQATGAAWQRERLVLSSGENVYSGGVCRRDGTTVPVERPLQLFQRWYGFAALFPNCEIYKKSR
jgi:hypothetical protein